jgi:hypothetical protein
MPGYVTPGRLVRMTEIESVVAIAIAIGVAALFAAMAWAQQHQS